MSELSFKIVLQDKKRPETKHRFRGDFTYEQLTDFLSFLWGGKKKLAVEYTDEDGDNILVLSEAEWRECVRLHLKQQEEHHETQQGRAPPLSLRVRQEKKILCSGAKKRRHHHTKDASSVPEAERDASHANFTAVSHVDVNTSMISSDDDSDSDAGVAYVTPSECSTMRLKGSAPTSVNSSMCRDRSLDAPANAKEPASLKSPKATAAAPEDTTSVASPIEQPHFVDIVPRLHLSAIGRVQRQASEVTANDDDAALMQLLSMIFSCDAALELYNPSVFPSPLAAVITTPSHKDGQGHVHVDIDLERVKRLALAKANERMDADPTQSRALLEAALKLFANDPLVLYNLACAAACEGNFETALMWLESALSAGYRSYDNISIDHDFDCIRKDPRFEMLISTYFPQSVALPAAPVVVVPVAAPVAAPIEAAPTTITPPETAAPAITPVDSTSIPAPPRVHVEESVIVPAATPRTTTMMSVFPGMTTKEAKSLLQLANNNVNVAIDWKLGHQ